MVDYIKQGAFVLYAGRICVVDYVDEYCAFLKDTDTDDMIFVSSDDFDKVKSY